MKYLFMTLFALAVLLPLRGAAAEDDRLLISQGQKLERSKNIAGALAFYEEALKKELRPGTRRTFLNRCAMFSRGQEKKLAYLNQALLLTGADPTEHYRTFWLLGHMHLRTAPDKALGFFLNMENENKIAASLVCSGYFEAGKIMEAKKNKIKALELYRKALSAGKSVPWRYDFSGPEKAVTRLEKELEKNK